MRKLEEDDESRSRQNTTSGLSTNPNQRNEICQLMRAVERERKLGRETAVGAVSHAEQEPEEGA